MRAISRAVLAALVVLCAQRSASAQIGGPPVNVTADRFTANNWSEVYPSGSFETGCVNGYLAFVFSPDGGFVFNHRTRGSWRVDGRGNLFLRTREGTKFQLLFDGNGLTSNSKTTFLKRFAHFAECS